MFHTRTRRQPRRPLHRHSLTRLAAVELPLARPLVVDPVGQPWVLGPELRHVAFHFATLGLPPRLGGGSQAKPSAISRASRAAVIWAALRCLQCVAVYSLAYFSNTSLALSFFFRSNASTACGGAPPELASRTCLDAGLTRRSALFQ